MVVVSMFSFMTIDANAAGSKEYATKLTKGVKVTGNTGTYYTGGSHQYYTFTLDTYANVTFTMDVEVSGASIQLEDDFETLEYFSGFYRYSGSSYYRKTVTKRLAPGKYYLVVILGAKEHAITVNWTSYTNSCNHTGTWTRKIAGNCEVDGMKTRVCTTCGMKEYEVISAPGHNWSEQQIIKAPTCTQKGQSAQVCLRCSSKTNTQTVEALGHSWNYGELITAPTVSYKGEIEYTCRSCGTNQSETIPALTAVPEKLCVTWNEVPVFDGTAKEPKPVVSYQGKLLAEGTDYTLSYSNNVMAGNHAVVQVTGTGNYRYMSTVTTFVIQPADIAELKANLTTNSAIYTGIATEPTEIVLKDWHDSVLENGNEYLIECSENVEEGIGKMRVIGLGNFTGYFDTTFSIIKTAVLGSDLNLSVPIESQNDPAEYYISSDTKINMETSTSEQDSGTLRAGDTYISNYSNPFTLEPGEHILTHRYTRHYTESGYEYGSDGVVHWVTREVSETETSTWNITVVAKEAIEASDPIAEVITMQDSDKVYLSVGSENNGKLPEITWGTTDPSVATVENGVVTLHKTGNATINASVGDKKLSWTLDDISALTLTKNTKILGYDPSTGKALVTWKDEVLEQGKDYTITTEDREGVTIVTANGINGFADSASRMFYKGTSFPYSCTEHKWKDATCTDPKTCLICGETTGTKLGHRWKQANCFDPRTCINCKLTDGSPLGHNFVNGTCTRCGDTEISEVDGVTRVYGGARYDTAIKAADTLKQQLGLEKFSTIVVASGEGFADALSGSYLAAVKDAPILLVRNNRNTLNMVKEYINNNLVSGGTVYLLGGESAVPKAMETGLDGFNVKRLGGANRYATNLLILGEAGVGDQDVLVCTGKGFADSLSASAAKKPILLVKDSLDNSQKEFLSEIRGKIYVIGGTSAVNARIESQLKTYGEVERLGGATRYVTSVLVAEEFFENPKSAVLAYSDNFPDGLSGGALACGIDAPLILTKGGKDSAAANYTKAQGIKDGIILGGPTLIPDKVVRNVFSMSADDTIIVK